MLKQGIGSSCICMAMAGQHEYRPGQCTMIACGVHLPLLGSPENDNLRTARRWSRGVSAYQRSSLNHCLMIERGRFYQLYKSFTAVSGRWLMDYNLFISLGPIPVPVSLPCCPGCPNLWSSGIYVSLARALSRCFYGASLC